VALSCDAEGIELVVTLATGQELLVPGIEVWSLLASCPCGLTNGRAGISPPITWMGMLSQGFH
jgi:hypothetical protein